MGRPKEFLLVDGYNIVNSWPELREISKECLEESRNLLIHILQDYQGYMGTNIIIIFDAHLREKGIERHEYFGEIEVVYTKEGETADQYIERWVNDMGKDYRVRVASSDFVEQTIVLSRGATRISARELYMEVKKVSKRRDEKHIRKRKLDSNHLSDNISPEIFEELERIRRQR